MHFKKNLFLLFVDDLLQLIDIGERGVFLC